MTVPIMCFKTSKLLSGYGLNQRSYQSMLRAQDYRCAICKKPFRKGCEVDHDHDDGITRGILCPSCNRGLACFHDDLETLRSASKYLISHGKGKG